MKGQLTGRLLIIIFSWIALIAILLLGLLFYKLSNNSATPPFESVTTPFVQTTLNAYLRETVTYQGQQVPFVEMLIAEIIHGHNKDEVEKRTKNFLAQTSEKTQTLSITISGSVYNLPWYSEGEPLYQPTGQATSSFPLPDGRTIWVKYEVRS